MKPISFIIPSRNNLRYLKWCYNSIRKNLGYIHEICIADDSSEDGTWDWLKEISKKDDGVKGVIVAGQFDTKLDHAKSMIPNSEVFLYEVDFKLKEYK